MRKCTAISAGRYVDFWGHAFTDARYAHRRVSYSDRKEFVEKSVEFMFARLQPSVDAFRRGISAVFDGCEGGYLQGRDLMEMVVGVGDVDVEELQKATQYEGYECDDQVIVWFWEILKEMKTSQRIAFLQFGDRAVAAANIFVPGAVDGRRFDRSMT